MKHDSFLIMAGKKADKKKEMHVFTKKELDTPASLAEERPLKIEKNTEKKITIDEEKIDEQITEIYANDDGTLPDMKHFERRQRRRLATALSVLTAACLFLVGAVWAGFFVLQPAVDFAGQEVALSLAGDTQVTAGQAVRYRIRYRNGERVNLQTVRLQVRYPDGFVLAESSVPPANEARDEWVIGALDAEASGFIDLFGRLYGTVGEEQSFRAFLHYTPENFSSEFQQVATLNTAVIAVPIELAVEGPESVVAGGDATLVIKLAPTGEAALANLALEVEGGGVFAIKPKESTKPDQFFTNRWSFASLAQPQALTVRGAVTPTTTESAGTITVRLIGWKDEERSAPPYVYQTVSRTLTILQTDLAANLVINGSAGDFSVQPGEVLNSSVILRNAGETALKQVVARVILDAPSVNRQSLLKWPELEDPKNGQIAGEQLNAERRRGIITWDRRQILDLRQLDPKEELVIDFSLPLKSAADLDLTEFPNGVIEATVEVQYELEGKKETFSTIPLRLTVNSDTALEVRDAITAAPPRPPSGLGAAGDNERHELKWVITNSFHELENIKVEADFYGEVVFTTSSESVPAGEINYDQEKKKLVWTIDKMPVGVDVLALSFALELKAVNPTQTNLTSKARFEATDTITGQKILKVGEEIKLAGPEGE